jgi:hypothetical protein
MIAAILATAAIAYPLAVGAAELSPETTAPRIKVAHHFHAYRHYSPAVHHGYYWHQWGLRVGGRGESWFGSRFVGVDPWWWQVRELYQCHHQLALQNPTQFHPCRVYVR